ncbi:MAG TPA: GFA family protein, partial [Casimicrobiaceae bacterium]|nr:GFA family protein [Casimicrobiaceae bacterium]
MTAVPDAPGEARGRCMCGTVRFIARFPSRFCCHCHCESCRRAHAAAFVTWVGFPSAQVRVTAGTDAVATY